MGVSWTNCTLLDRCNNNINAFAIDVDEKVVRIMLPVYYHSAPLTAGEFALARNSWSMIITSSSPIFVKNILKGLDQFPFFSCEEWFQELFYGRLFDVHPISKTLFKSPRKQGIFLTALFSFIFSTFEDPKRLRDRLVELAESHCKKGVKACEYGVIGEVMFWTLSQVLGREYSSDIHTAWMKIFSTMLRVIVPISINYELQSNAAQIKRLADFEEYCIVGNQLKELPRRNYQQIQKLDSRISRLAVVDYDSSSSETSDSW